MLAALLLNAKQPQAQQIPQRWGGFTLVRRRASKGVEEEEIVEEIEQPVIIDFDGVATDALEKIQVKLKAETFIDIEAGQEERRRAQEEEEILMLWMED